MAKRKKERPVLKPVLTKADKAAAAAEKELTKAVHSISALLPWR